MAMMGQREYARHRLALGLPGGTLAAVQKALKSGRIAPAQDGKIDSDAADASWAARTDAALQRAVPPAVEKAPEILPVFDGVVEEAPTSLSRRPVWEVPFPPPEPVKISRPPAPVVEVSDSEAYQKNRARREAAEAGRAELAYARERKTLVPRSDAEQLLTEVARVYAAKRESVPGALAPRLVGKTDPDEIARIVRKELRETDRRIADEVRTITERGLGGGDVAVAG
jgi:hypothetical protein